MIRTVIFDIGNVLAGFEWREHFRNLGYEEEMVERLGKATVQSGNWNEYDRGCLTDEQIETVNKYMALVENLLRVHDRPRLDERQELPHGPLHRAPRRSRQAALDLVFHGGQRLVRRLVALYPFAQRPGPIVGPREGQPLRRHLIQLAHQDAQPSVFLLLAEIGQVADLPR